MLYGHGAQCGVVTVREADLSVTYLVLALIAVQESSYSEGRCMSVNIL